MMGSQLADLMVALKVDTMDFLKVSEKVGMKVHK
jgi:hypothetical protein